MGSALEQLQKMGFRKCCKWSLDGGVLQCIPPECGDYFNVLYAFVCAGEVLYVGKAKRKLRARMHGYSNPGRDQTQTTNIHGGKKLRKLCKDGETPEVWVLQVNDMPDDDNVKRATELRDNLIKQIRPPWNKRVGKG